MDTDLAPSDLPHGVSPDCQDLQFTIGSVKTRPGVTALYTLPGGPSFNYLKTFFNLQEVQRLLSLDSLGNFRTDNPPGGALSVIFGDIIPGAFAKSASLFAREYIAFSNGTVGLDMPRQYDDTYFDRVSQVGPGAAPTVADSGAAGNISAGLHMLSVIFVTRSGYYTNPAPPTSWTAAGGNTAAVTNIPVGPPNVIARVLTFTASAQASFYHLGPQGATLPNSNMYIADNFTTSLTVDFTDGTLLLGTLDDPLFDQIVLPPVAGTIDYSSRLFHWGEQANIQNFLNLSFDGGFAGTPVAANSGAASPTAAQNDINSGAIWINPANVFAPDGNNATVVLGHLAVSRELQVSGYGFNIPLNATIVGVVVQARVAQTGFGLISDNSVFLMQGNAIIGTNHANGFNWPGALFYLTYGSAVDQWGAVLTPAIVNSPTFGVTYTAQSNATASSGTAEVDYLPITVYYTTPGVGTVPLGWTAGASAAGGSSALSSGYTAVFGGAYAITGDGVTAVRGLITQSAAADYLTNPIILPGVAYGVRARVAQAGNLAQGTLHINLQSTIGRFTTGGLGVQALQAGAAYEPFTGVLTSALLGPIPADLSLQVYVDGTPNLGGVFLVDEIEIYPLNQQWNTSNVRASFAQLDTQGQESYDELTGLIEYNLNDGQSVRSMFKIRERLYIVKEHSFGVTEDTGTSEPSFWTVNDVSTKVGTPSINGVGIGEDWVVIAHRSGLYLYWGGEVLTISQEIQPTWDTINWQYGSTISVTVDIRKRRIFVTAPFGASTVPNKTLVLDYHDVGSDASAIASSPPIHLTYTGRKTAFDKARKWCPWTVSANCSAMIENVNGLAYIYFGSNDGSGNINELDDTGAVFTDNGNVIPSYYTTAAFAELPTEDGKQLKSHRHLYTYLTMYVQGSGTIGVTVFPSSLSNAIVLNPQTLSNPAVRDLEMYINQSIERMFLKISSQGLGEWFDLQRAVMNMKPEPWSIVRGGP